MLSLAGGLRNQGVTLGSHVAVALPNGLNWLVAWLAASLLGAVIVPVNFRYTGRELKYVLEDSEASFLIIDEGVLSVYREIGQSVDGVTRTRVIVASRGPIEGYRTLSELALGGPLEQKSLPILHAGDLASIQYTSGSTGFPKGCMLTHEYWITIATVMANVYLPKHQKILIYQPFYYMDPQWQFLMAVLNKGTAFIAAGPSAQRYLSWVRDFGVEYAIFPEIVFKKDTREVPNDLQLRRVNIFGWGKNSHIEAQERYPFFLREAYGMTEIGMGTYMPEEASHMVGSRSCGRVAPFRECKIVKSDGSDASTGETGELWVRGRGIFLGYYRRPEVNKECFVGEWFRTGDLFSADDEGNFFFHGQLKDMIRRSGENIAAQEVEAVLRSFPLVIEAAVVGVEDELRGEEVKAYIVFSDGNDPRRNSSVLSDLIKFCEKQLASFKIPRYIHPVEHIPKTPSNKISKKDLVEGVADLRSGTFDRITKRWIEAAD